MALRRATLARGAHELAYRAEELLDVAGLVDETHPEILDASAHGGVR
jgi:hypothetical protein